ncbi:hypothetical protein HMN09_00063400 [Mycena chlorophos]|uniref:Chromatin assembly factor 1 subunit A dimerization domain-containing protein n=1 Tax=Mycena chlorophos TaxID=658473 RepID=A0A8H6TW58_MYCCL|nr:hypothetical protein HMN09_00063400 [Mycena chlorophos]
MVITHFCCTEIVKFRDLLEERVAAKAEGLTAIPDEHKPVIAKLVHERRVSVDIRVSHLTFSRFSDKTLSALCKHILQELLPAQDEDDEAESSTTPPPLTLSVLECGIKEVASRNNYGLDGLPGVKAPAAVCVWRWEVRSVHLDWLPKNAREKAETRMAERAQAKLDLKKQLEALPKSERDHILDPKGTASAGPSSTIDLTLDSPVPAQKKQTTEPEAASFSSDCAARKVGRPKKILNDEELAKEKEKQEKKAAKAEREQKEKEAQNKSRNMMKSFFAPKPKSTSPTQQQPKTTSASVDEISQYHKTFKPFVLKKDTTLAPVNWFATQKDIRPLRYDGDVIVLDDDDGRNLAGESPSERLRSILREMPRRRRVYRRSAPSQLKTSNAVSVRDLMGQMSEAEVAGDVALVRSIASKLSDRNLVPAKVLIFADDARPGYFGTWTRDSRVIGPRSALKRDAVVFDYDYDSGGEWEEEPAGDGDDIVEDERSDVDGDDRDSDADSWLVDDDEEIPSLPGSRSASPVVPMIPLPPKRKADGTNDAKAAKKRKVVVPLVPFARGPCYEEKMGKCELPLFAPYRIQLLNDTPFPLDPFTFVSRAADVRNSNAAAPAAPSPSMAKRPALAPKTVFPEAHVPFLLDRINSMQQSSLPILIDTIYQGLRAHNVKKNSIEVKVREVAEKCKFKKVWVVKENFQGQSPAMVQ